MFKAATVRRSFVINNTLDAQEFWAATVASFVC